MTVAPLRYSVHRAADRRLISRMLVVDGPVAMFESCGSRYGQTSAYRWAVQFHLTPTGRRLHRLLGGPHNHKRLMAALDKAAALPTDSREAPINVAHLRLRQVIRLAPDISMIDLLPLFDHHKPTLQAWLRWLVEKALVRGYVRADAPRSSRYQAGSSTRGVRARG